MKRPARVIALLLTGLALISLAAALAPCGAMLTIQPKKGGPPLAAIPLPAGGLWTLYYFHSVNGLPIWEVHSVDDRGRIFMEEEIFVAFGAGQGHWKGHGRHLIRHGYQVLAGIHKPTGDFILRVGSARVAHTIIWAHGRVNLSKTAAGKAVLVSARPASFLRSLWQRFFNRFFSSTIVWGKQNVRPEPKRGSDGG